MLVQVKAVTPLPGTGKNHLSIGLGIAAAQHGHRVLVAAAMIDHIVHHADVLTLKGSSYRLRNTDIDTLPSHRASDTAQ